MAYRITHEDVWVGAIEDRPGGLADKLEAIAHAGDNLEFMVVMRTLQMPSQGVLFLSPLREDDVKQAAERGGMSKWTTVHSLRVEGPDKQGLAAGIARALAEVDLNIRGATVSIFGDQAVFYLAFDSSSDAERGRQQLERVLNG